jgi:hypothetical protein
VRANKQAHRNHAPDSTGRGTSKQGSTSFLFLGAKGSRKPMLTNELKTTFLQSQVTEAQLAAVFGTMDNLHDLVCDGKLAEVSNLPTKEVVGWLRDILYTVSETIRELEVPAQVGWEDFRVKEEGGMDA